MVRFIVLVMIILMFVMMVVVVMVMKDICDDSEVMNVLVVY